MLVNVFSKLLGAAAVCLLVSSATLAEEQEFAGNYQLISAPRENSRYRTDRGHVWQEAKGASHVLEGRSFRHSYHL